MATQVSKYAYSRRKARAYIKTIFPNLRRLQFVHHLDENPMNNDPVNLAIMGANEHGKYHMTKYRDAQQPQRLLETLRELEGLLIIYNEPLGL